MRDEAETQIVGVLRERRPDRIILCNGTQIFLRQGVSADHCPLGRSLTIRCAIRNGRKFAEEIVLNSDWLLDVVETLSLAGWNDTALQPEPAGARQQAESTPVRETALAPKLVA